MSETKKCGNQMCKCVVGDDKKYCSTYCEDAKDTTSLSCDCGHTACEVNKL